MANHVGWAFLGTGRVTLRMAAAVAASQTSQLVAIASRSLNRAEDWLVNLPANTHVFQNSIDLKVFSGVEAVQGYESIFNRSDIDWVYIATPPATHFELAMAAMLHGKHVLCEKPLVFEPEQAAELLQVSKETGLRILDATSFPYHPRTRAILEIIKSGKLGSLRKITIACSFSDLLSRPSDHRWQPALGGGCLMDLGWYCVHASLFLADKLPVSIQAIGSPIDEKAEGIGRWKSLVAQAAFADDLFAHWDCSFETTGRKWIEIAGQSGTIVCDDLLRPIDLNKPRFWYHDAAGNATTMTVGAATLQEANMIDFTVNEPVPAVQSRFAIAVQTQKVLQLVHQAAMTGNRVDL